MTLRQADSVSPTEEVQSRRSARKEFRPDIEGLRAVAVVAVVLFHAETPGIGGGFIGVDVFFVISGFLITGLLWREVSTAGTVRLRRFYGARARRLLPASAAVGVVTAIASAVLLPPLQAVGVLYDGIASALYVSNYWFISQGVHYFGGHKPPSPFQHYWSLGVEEQFYLVWPAIIIGTAWLIRRARRRSKATEAQASPSSQRPYLVVLALVAAASFAMSLVITYVMPAIAFFSLPTRAWQLAAGGLVALTAGQWRRLPPLARRDHRMGRAGGGPAGLQLFERTTPYPGIAALLPALGTALVIGAGCADTFAGMRSHAGGVADAGDRPGVVLVVSVALAGAGARTVIAGPPAGAARQVGSGPGFWRAGVAHTASHREPAAIHRSGAPLRPGQSCAGRYRHRGRGLCRCGAAGMGACPGRTRRTSSSADYHRGAGPHGRRH